MIPMTMGKQDRKHGDCRMTTISSAMETGTFPAPPVVAVTTGRTAAALTTCTPPAMSKPHASASTG